jgi:hyperosmotically inducible protein
MNMNRILLLLSMTALVLAPGPTLAQSKTTTQSKATPDVNAAKTEDNNGGHFMKDSWITTKTKTKLVANGRTKARRITVETQDGVVTLLGKVGSSQERATAEEIAKGVSGVKGIRNVLQVVPDADRKSVDARDADIKKAVAERLKKDDPLKEADIKVRSDNGVVTLSGTVPDARVKTRAADLTRRTPGVKTVRNELQLKG